MPSNLKCCIKKIIWPLVVIKRFIIQKHSILHKTGWVDSFILGYPCRSDGKPLPWMNYSIISFLEQRLNKTMRVFEFGSGYSTLFYARFVESVVAVEHNREWFETMRPQVPENSRIIFQEKDRDGQYCRTVKEPGVIFNLVVIDGRDRLHSLQQSLEVLADDGVIIFDDSNRSEYREAMDYARKSGFKAIHFCGLKPRSNSIFQTSILYRPHNCFDI